MRAKQGLYGGDLGLVEKIEDNKVWLRLIPRLDLNKDQNKSLAERNKKQFQIRPPQRIFNSSQVPKALQDAKQMRMGDLMEFIVYKKQVFRNGFLYKSFPIKQLDTENVRPTIEEVQNFATYMN